MRDVQKARLRELEMGGLVEWSVEGQGGSRAPQHHWLCEGHVLVCIFDAWFFSALSKAWAQVREGDGMRARQPSGCRCDGQGEVWR
jgi:hypothetical protein